MASSSMLSMTKAESCKEPEDCDYEIDGLHCAAVYDVEGNIQSLVEECVSQCDTTDFEGETNTIVICYKDISSFLIDTESYIGSLYLEPEGLIIETDEICQNDSECNSPRNP